MSGFRVQGLVKEFGCLGVWGFRIWDLRVWGLGVWVVSGPQDSGFRAYGLKGRGGGGVEE